MHTPQTQIVLVYLGKTFSKLWDSRTWILHVFSRRKSSHCTLQTISDKRNKMSGSHHTFQFPRLRWTESLPLFYRCRTCQTCVADTAFSILGNDILTFARFHSRSNDRFVYQHELTDNTEFNGRIVFIYAGEQYLRVRQMECSHCGCLAAYHYLPKDIYLLLKTAVTL